MCISPASPHTAPNGLPMIDFNALSDFRVRAQSLFKAAKQASRSVMVQTRSMSGKGPVDYKKELETAGALRRALASLFLLERRITHSHAPFVCFARGAHLLTTRPLL